VPLPPPQGQQLCVRGEDLGHSLFKLPTLVHKPLNFLDPSLGDVLHALLALGHEGESPNGVPPLVLSTVAGRLAAAVVRERERSGKEIGRDGKATEEFELALAETGGLGSFWCELHMHVMIRADSENQALFSGMRK